MNIGERVGDYEIVAVLGAGGMGQVYKVRNVLSDRVEAMKVLLPNLEGDSELAERFLREIKVQAALDHPHIAKLHTAMTVGNQLVMVMEFVDGVSLAQILEGGPIPANTVVAYIAQVLDALAYAHARGVIHRDIKPANIMVTGMADGRDGAVKLMDFGIARMKADRQLTQTGSTVGSLAYMSPEQIRGGEPDPRSDLYSVGITMYEMVTGRRPFQGDSDFSIMSAHIQEAPVAPIEVTPGVPQVVNDLILMAIEKDPAVRFQSAEAFRAALGSAFPKAVASAIATKTINPLPTMPMKAAPTPPPVTQAAPLPMTRVASPPPMPQAASPPPMPQSFAAPPMPPPPSAAKGRRGLYMALGSLATILVLIGAIIEGPKLMHGGAADAQGSPAIPGSQTPAVATPLPVTQPPSAPASQPVTQPVSQPAASQPVTQPSPVAAPQARTKQVQQAVPVPVEQPFRRAAPQSSPEPAPQAQPAVVQTPQAQPAAPPAPSRPSQAQTEMNEVRERFNEVSIHASTARAGVRSIEQQMARQGLGLRSDIREAQTRLDYLMQEANSSIQRGDVEGARRNLQYADGTLAIIDKFLGR